MSGGDNCVVFCVQDVRHRDVMGLLCSADRNSLITEIHQLRAQRHPVDTSGMTLDSIHVCILCVVLLLSHSFSLQQETQKESQKSFRLNSNKLNWSWRAH